MPTGFEIQAYRNLDTIAKEMRRVVAACERIAERLEALETNPNLQPRNERVSGTAGTASGEAPE